MNWDDFLDTANRLVSGDREGDWRSAISRSYYCVFHFFADFFKTYGLDLGQGGQCHFNLYSGLLNCGVSGVEKIAVRVDEFRQRRVHADYKLRLPIRRAQAEQFVKEADDMIAEFKELLANADEREIADGAKTYLQRIGRLPKD